MDSIFVYRDQTKPTIVWGFVSERSPAALPQEGADWQEVPQSEFTPPPKSRGRIDDEIREGIRIRGYHVIELTPQ
jgi:hypothetical protein